MPPAEPSYLFLLATGVGLLFVTLLWQLFGLRKSNERLKYTSEERELVIARDLTLPIVLASGN